MLNKRIANSQTLKLNLKQMNIIPHKNSNLSYPVGENMSQAITYINTIIPLLQPIIKDYSLNIWCRGSSGAILAALLASKINNTCIICHVKKEGESSHSMNDFYFTQNNESLNIIIDDFTRSGHTLNCIWKEAKRCVKSINVLILDNSYKEPWNLEFIPNNFIINEESIHCTWNDLIPTRNAIQSIDISELLEI